MAEAELPNMRLQPNAFEPLHVERRVQSLSRPSLSYWQDAWLRLKANRRALGSLYIVMGLLIFTLFGPLLWPVDPAAQDLDQISRPPLASRDAVIVEPYRPWGSTRLDLPGSGLTLAEPATTQAVRLLWQPMPGAGAYRIYRNIYPMEPGQALGLPLAEVLAGEATAFEDRMDLRPRRYYYTVVALDAVGEETRTMETLEVQVRRVITLEDAVERGLVTPEAALVPGDAVKLALHPLGTDYLGRDMLARLMYGARVSLFIGICAPFLFVLFGVVYGSASGFLGGRYRI